MSDTLLLSLSQSCQFGVCASGLGNNFTEIPPLPGSPQVPIFVYLTNTTTEDITLFFASCVVSIDVNTANRIFLPAGQSTLVANLTAIYTPSSNVLFLSYIGVQWPNNFMDVHGLFWNPNRGYYFVAITDLQGNLYQPIPKTFAATTDCSIKNWMFPWFISVNLITQTGYETESTIMDSFAETV
jgi:hypothetical protein